MDVERGSSAVDCRTRNQVSPGSNPPFQILLPFQSLGIFSIRCPSSLSRINDYLAIDSGGNVNDFVVERNCCVAGMLPRAELVSE